MLHGPLQGHSVLNYLDSHDDGNPFDALRQHPMESANKLLLAPGQAQIYYGDETARVLKIEGAEGDANLRSFMNWDQLKNNTRVGLFGVADVRDHWARLGRFRHAHPAVGAGVHQMLAGQPLHLQAHLREGRRDGPRGGGARPAAGPRGGDYGGRRVLGRPDRARLVHRQERRGLGRQGAVRVAGAGGADCAGLIPAFEFSSWGHKSGASFRRCCAPFCFPYRGKHEPTPAEHPRPHPGRQRRHRPRLVLLAKPKDPIHHRRRGRVFVLLTCVVCLSAAIGNALFRFMPLFAVLTVLVSYQLLSGWHVIYTRAAGPNRLDAGLLLAAAAIGAMLVRRLFADGAMVGRIGAAASVMVSTLAAVRCCWPTTLRAGCSRGAGMRCCGATSISTRSSAACSGCCRRPSATRSRWGSPGRSWRRPRSA
jgi:hypothetical protein